MIPRLKAVPINRSVLAVLIAVQNGARSVDEIATTIDRCRSVAYGHMCHARAKGLITWDPDSKGTIRPLVVITQSERTI